MGQAAAATGFSKDSLKRAKELGCMAFKPGGRVDGAALREWMRANEAKLRASTEKPGGGPLKDQKLAEEIRKLRIKNDRDDGLSVLKSKIGADLHALASEQLALLRQRLENELPSQVAGLEPSNARIIFKRVVDELSVKMQGLVAKWTE